MFAHIRQTKSRRIALLACLAAATAIVRTLRDFMGHLPSWRHDSMGHGRKRPGDLVAAPAGRP